MSKPTLTITVTRRFDFSPEQVFDAWLNPAAAGRWLFRTDGADLITVKIDARVGGKFEISEQRGAMLARHMGEYVEIERPRRLVFDFAAGAGDDLSPMTRVAIDIKPDGGGCVLTLTHKGVWEDFAERTEAGWTKLLGDLAVLFAGGAA